MSFLIWLDAADESFSVADDPRVATAMAGAAVALRSRLFLNAPGGWVLSLDCAGVTQVISDLGDPAQDPALGIPDPPAEHKFPSGPAGMHVLPISKAAAHPTIFLAVHSAPAH